MRTSRLFVIAALAVAAASCAEEAQSPVEADLITVPAFQRAGAERPWNFRTHASGDEEVPPVETNAQGQAIFRLSSDGDALHYKLIVANIVDVTMSHIHLAPAGENGPVVAWLYPAAPPPALLPGRTQGVLAEGTLTAADLVGDLAGMDLDALVEALRSGNAYVNVHTDANPGGEVRGQIR